jgi:hypothetical protein
MVRVYLDADAMEDEGALLEVERLCSSDAWLSRHPIDRVWELTVVLAARTVQAASAGASGLVGSVAVGAILRVEVLPDHEEMARRRCTQGVRERLSR